MKKSISKKLNIFKTSPLIGIVAIIEVILLLCVSTFAWFVFSENNTVNTDVISVEPDSGLEIDFSDANDNDYINIWNYLNEFQFEPVTSLDGRNIFIPTTGTFNATDTGNIKFREATVNDMNSKYINIDFTLSNTSEEDMPVYLNSKSYFKFDNSANGKALRLAFYQNDGSSGKVTSSLLSQEYDGEEPTEPPTVVEPTEGPGDTQANFLIYFDVSGSSWDQVWIETDHTANLPGNTNRCFKMTHHKDNIYYIDLKTLIKDIDDSLLTFIKFRRDPNSNDSTYTSVQLPEHDIYHNYLYSFKLNSSGNAYTGNFNSGYGMLLKESPSIYTGEAPDLGGGGSGDSGATETPTEAPTTPDEEGKITVYFNNTLGWKQPYAYIWRENGNADEPLSAWPGKPMTHISGSIYYYTFNAKYDSIIFNDGNQQGGAVKTGDIYPVKDGHIYMISQPTGDNTFGWKVEDYIGTVDGGTYPVISPGVSTGFQRPYAPVIEIDDNSGDSKIVVPAFASSIDDYNYGSNNPLFTIKAKQTMSLSMIVWLEGTDPDCTDEVYAGKDIDMNLIFATKDSGEEMYTYKFLDKTRENWIDDRVTTDTGVSFKPVIQLYDVDNQKGYMMSVHDDENGKPTIWQCNAPEDLIDSEHIMFRRVNPMKEDEVWNYWDTDGFKDLGIVEDSVVTFTAFSDGAPTTAKNENGTTYTGAPEKSCGGLWGDHAVHTVTLFDGTNGQWIKNSDKDGTTSVLTMNYLYKYANGKTQTVEYKASGATDKGMYYFVVPYNVYSKNGSNHTQDNSITFKRYFNFNDKYALNSNLNELTYHMSWNAGICNGKFYEITEDSSGNKWSYWGSDMLYVQVKNIAKSKMDDAFMQVHFYANSTGSDSSDDFYTYLYKNNYYAPSDGGYGYGCVVPSNRRYYSYRVERCNPSDHGDKWDVTPSQEVTYESSTNNAHSNTVGKNICSIENFQITLFLQLSTNYCGYNNDPYCYIWDAVGSNGNAGGWPGKEMTFYSDQVSGYNQYHITMDISRYNALIFNNEDTNSYKTADIKGVGGVGTDRNGMIYQSTSSQSNYAELLKSNNKPMIMSGYKDNETMNAVLYEAEYWDINGTAGTN
ncbi:MAG: starch-binding protein [Ruminococcus sp.]|nr:starch-binding protein [Ruminococcus sp.]